MSRPELSHGLNLYNEPWIDSASCREVGTDVFYPEPGESWREALAICQFRCPVRLQCLDYAMRCEQGRDHKTRFGVYGGLTPIKRKKHEPEWLANQQESAA